jgi:large subunit ribosomal protein L21
MAERNETCPRAMILEGMEMYAVFQSGGKQYQVEPGKVIKLEKLPGEVGAAITLDQVILVGDGDQVEIGHPLLKDTTVCGRIVEQGRHRKILVFKHKRRKDYRKQQGHRQHYTAVLIQSIERRAEEPSSAVS